MENAMHEHIKKHDLRDDIFMVKTTVIPMHHDVLENAEERESLKSDGAPLAAPDKGAVVGQTTHM
jgi:hypothetical protein